MAVYWEPMTEEERKAELGVSSITRGEPPRENKIGALELLRKMQAIPNTLSDIDMVIFINQRLVELEAGKK